MCSALGEARISVPDARRLRTYEVVEGAVDRRVGQSQDRGERPRHRGQRDTGAAIAHDGGQLSTAGELEPALALPGVRADRIRRAQRVLVATEDRPQARAVELEARAEDPGRIGA